MNGGVDRHTRSHTFAHSLAHLTPCLPPPVFTLCTPPRSRSPSCSKGSNPHPHPPRIRSPSCSKGSKQLRRLPNSERLTLSLTLTLPQTLRRLPHAERLIGVRVGSITVSVTVQDGTLPHLDTYNQKSYLGAHDSPPQHTAKSPPSPLPHTQFSIGCSLSLSSSFRRMLPSHGLVSSIQMAILLLIDHITPSAHTAH